MLWPPPETVADHLATSVPAGEGGEDRRSALIDHLIRRRHCFGITRVASVTGLDWVGIPVVQVVRPLALSNAAVQGKGRTYPQATVSALMEALETWAAERPPPADMQGPLSAADPHLRALFRGAIAQSAPDGAEDQTLRWCRGWDLATAAPVAVPTALVDTLYKDPSPHPHVFPRTTTGLGGGSTMAGAIIHAGLEILERDGVARALADPRFYDHRQIDLAAEAGAGVRHLVGLLERAGLVAGAWLVPGRHGLPVYSCHLMERGSRAELAPLPAVGYGCAFTHGEALEAALLEAAQARLSAISGAREDITQECYPASFDRSLLDGWRDGLARPRRVLHVPSGPDGAGGKTPGLPGLVAALREAGALAVIVVPLYIDPEAGIFIVRVVAPPLRHGHAR